MDVHGGGISGFGGGRVLEHGGVLRDWLRHLAALGLAAVLALTAGAVAGANVGDGTLAFTAGGVGVTGYVSGPSSATNEIGYTPGSGQTEALAVDLGRDAVSASVVVSWLFLAEGERGAWQAFNAFGQPVGSGTIDGNALTGYSSGTGSLAIGGIGSFRYLVFTALPYVNQGSFDSSEYYVQSILVSYADQSSATFGGAGAGEAAWAGAGLSAFNFGTPFLDASGRFLGAAPEPIVVDKQTCTADGANNTNCKIKFTNALTTTIAGDDVEGTIAIAGIYEVVDFRAGCGFSGPNPNQTLGGASKAVAVTADGGLDLGFVLEPGVTGPIVPAHLCGIPDGDGTNGKFVVLNLDAAIQVTRSVIEHEIQNTAHPCYECASGAEVLATANANERRSRLPVFGWLPKTTNQEIPVFDGNRQLVPVLEDLTTGCGSTRGGSRILSFLVYDLHHALNADYKTIIAADLEQLRVTVEETRSCLDPATAKNLSSRVRLMQSEYQKNRLAYVKNEAIGFLKQVTSARLDREFARCGFDFTTDGVTVFNPADPDMLPRNFRGDLVVQTRHILYMMERMLGVLSPTVPKGL